MSGEMIRVYGTPVTLEANGASIANNTIGAADDDTYSVTTDGGGYPDADFTLACAYTTAPTEGTVIGLVARLLNIDGTNDADVPEYARPDRTVGAFVVNNTGGSAVQYMQCTVYDVPEEASYYLTNVGTGQTINSGWTLKVTPRTNKPAP